MENLFSTTLKEISDEMQSIASALLNSNGMDSRESLELYRRLAAANLKLAPVMGSVNYFEREHGSFRELATHKLKHPAPAQPAPGLPAITLPEGVTLEAFADNILPKAEEAECPGCWRYIPWENGALVSHSDTRTGEICSGSGCNKSRGLGIFPRPVRREEKRGHL